MNKLVVLTLIAACAGSPKPPPTTPPPTTTVVTTPKPEPKPATFKAGPNGIPIPLDADDGQPASGASMITVFKVPRGKLVVAEEMRAILAEVGWEIAGEEVSPRGAIRLELTKAGETSVMLRMTGDDAQTALIVQPKN